MFYLAGIGIAFFLSFLLFSKKNNSFADKILASWLVVVGIHLLFFYFNLTGKIYAYPWLLGLHMPIPLLHGPFLYIYAAASTGNLNGINKKSALHFIPALLSYAYLVPFFLLPTEQKIYVFKNKGIGYETFIAVNISAIMISGIAYVILTTLLHRKHRRNILNQFSYSEKINLDWIQYLIYGIALIWIFVIWGNDDFVFGAAVFFVLFIGYFGIRQVGIFTNGHHPQVGDIENPSEELPGNAQDHAQRHIHSTNVEENIPEKNQEISPSATEGTFDGISPSPKKYSKSGLSREASAELHENLKSLIQAEKIFNQSELTLTELAKKLGTHPNYLSQVINDKEGKNFYDYINTLRTEEFKKIVSNPVNRKFTLLSLAFECGFNSKSSFNKYFKKVTGLSPSQYLQQLNIEKAA